MDKYDYFCFAVKNDLHKRRDWVVSAFCIVESRPAQSDVAYHGQLMQYPPQADVIHWYNATESKAVPIIGSRMNAALFNAKESIIAKAGTLPMIHSDTATTYGQLLANLCLLYYPFGDLFPYTTSVIKGSFDSVLAERLVDDPPPGQPAPEGKITVTQLHAFSESCGYLASLAPIFASSGSRKAVTVDPSVLQLRDKLLKEHAHELDNKAVVAKIEDELVKADKATFKGDDAEDFLITGKSFNPTRKKMLVMIGASEGFGQSGGKYDFIAGSLRDRWKVKDIPAYANEARSGSYNRGKETQMGGADVKVSFRMAWSLSIAEEFCGATTGFPTQIRDDLPSSFYIGRYIVGKTQPIEITKENLQQYMNQTVMLHSPQYCRTKGSGLCAVCMSKRYSVMRHAMPNVVSNIGDVFMYDKMKRMHGKPLVGLTIDLSKIQY